MTDDGLAIGVDIGGTKISAGAVDPSGTVVDRELRETPERTTTPAVAEDLIVEAVSALAARHAVVAVGVGAAGFVNADRTRVMFAPHLSWRNEPLAVKLADRLGRPVLLDNDANTALWGEQAFGAARGVADAVLITLGTGIGGALLIDGVVHRGRNGMAGEFGHMQVVPAGRPCECGNTGCWEQYCSGKALRRFVADAGSPLTGAEITEAAYAGDPVALGAYGEVGRWLGTGVAGVVAALDPERVIIGGGVSAGGELLLGPARTTLAATLVGRNHRPLPDLVPAQLGADAGLVGAAQMARAAVAG
jgi:glucokinase